MTLKKLNFYSIIVSDEHFASPLPPGSAGFGSVEPVSIEDLLNQQLGDMNIFDIESVMSDQTTPSTTKKKKKKNKQKTNQNVNNEVLKQQLLQLMLQKQQLADNIPTNFQQNPDGNILSSDFSTIRPQGTVSFPTQRPNGPVSGSFPYESIQSLSTPRPTSSSYSSTFSSFDDGLADYKSVSSTFQSDLSQYNQPTFQGGNDFANYNPTQRPISSQTISSGYPDDLPTYNPTSRPIQNYGSGIEQAQYGIVSTPASVKYGSGGGFDDGLPQYSAGLNSNFRGSPNGESWSPVPPNQPQQQGIYQQSGNFLASCHHVKSKLNIKQIVFLQSGFSNTPFPSQNGYASSNRPVRFPQPETKQFANNRNDQYDPHYDDDYSQHDEWYDPMTKSYHQPSTFSDSPNHSPLVPPPSYKSQFHTSSSIIAEQDSNGNRRNLLDNGDLHANQYIQYDKDFSSKGSEIIMYPSGQLMLGVDPYEPSSSTIGPKLESYLGASYNDGQKLRNQMPYYVLTKKKDDDEESKEKNEGAGILPMLLRSAKDDLKLVGNVIKYALA